jgi:hypothetical protein
LGAFFDGSFPAVCSDGATLPALLIASFLALAAAFFAAFFSALAEVASAFYKVESQDVM